MKAGRPPRGQQWWYNWNKRTDFSWYHSGTFDSLFLHVMFITFEGGDGCGKSTQIQLTTDWFLERKIEVVLCRDPGSTALGNAVRDILLNRTDLKIESVTEMLLFMAARAQMVEEVIRPAMERGKTVLCDRFVLSSYVYQGCAGAVPLASLETVGKIATGGLEPGLGIVLDIPYEKAIQRLENRDKSKNAKPDRMESKGAEYHKRVRQGFLDLAAREPQRYVVLDACENVESVQGAIRKIISQY